MGGSPNLLMPVHPAYVASWYSHTRRSPRSSEPGTDMFVPIGTPIYAPGDGEIYGTGNTIGPATGRWVGIDLDNGMRFRCMHLSRLVTLPRRVKRGALIGYSGASGYGHEDWSHLAGMPAAHTHVTLWPSHASRFGYQASGSPFTVDFMNYVGGAAAGAESPAEPPAPKVRRKSMITAAYRNDDTSIAIQRDPNGPLVWVEDPNEWQGIVAANPGLYAAQVSNAWLRAHMDKWGLIPRFTPPASDLPTVVTVIGSKSQYMQTSSGLVPIDGVTASALADRGAVSYAVSLTVAEALLAKPASDS